MKDAKSRWIKAPNSFNQATEIGDMIKLYTNYALTGTWMKSNEKETKFVAMATELWRKEAKEESKGNVRKETSFELLVVHLQR